MTVKRYTVSTVYRQQIERTIERNEVARVHRHQRSSKIIADAVKQGVKKGLDKISDKQFNELIELYRAKEWSSLKNRINKYAGETLCSTCNSSNATAIAIMEHEMQRRNDN